MKKEIKAARKKPIKRFRATGEHFLYTVSWSEDDEAYVARVAEFPSLAAHGRAPEAAVLSLQRVVKAVVQDLAVSNEPLPTDR